MSLISDALKKAQRQRTVEAPGGEGPRVIIRRGSTPAAKQIFFVAGGVVVVVVAVAIVAVVKLRPSEEEIAARVALATAKAKSAPPAKNATSEPAGPAPAVVPAADPGAKAPAADASPVVVLKIPTSGGNAAPGPAAPIAPAPERPALVGAGSPTAGAARPAASGSLQDYIDTLRVTGWSVGTTPADSKVMINDKVYRINDVVDRALGLKLTDVKSDRITLSDERGGTYVRRL
jgi:hypothetical protein